MVVVVVVVVVSMAVVVVSLAVVVVVVVVVVAGSFGRGPSRVEIFGALARSGGRHVRRSEIGQFGLRQF